MLLLFASYHYSERTRVTDWWRKKSFLSTSVFVAFLLSYSLTLRQLRSYSLTWGSCSYSVTSNNRKRLLKIAQCEPGFKQRVESIATRGRDTVSRALPASAIRDGVKHRQMCFIHNHSNTPHPPPLPGTVFRRAPRSLGSALQVSQTISDTNRLTASWDTSWQINSVHILVVLC